MKTRTRTEDKLEEMGVRPYYYRDGHSTICLLLKAESDEAVARGIAICSPRDAYVKRVGRAKALGRAVKALVRCENTEPIEPERFVMDTDFMGAVGRLYKEFMFKSIRSPLLTSKECELLHLTPRAVLDEPVKAPGDCPACYGRGWLFYTVYPVVGATYNNIERCDACMLYATDGAAETAARKAGFTVSDGRLLTT